MNAFRVAALCAAALVSCKKETPATPAAPAQTLPAPPRPAPPPIDDAVVAKFIAYDKKYLASLPQRMRAMRDELRKLEDEQKKKGPAAAAAEQDGARAVLDRMTAEDRQMRKDAGLTDEQAHAMQELSLALASSKKGKGDMNAARRRFGDAAVDAVVRNQARLVPLAEQHLAVFQEAMKMMMQR
jgi:hypothetical protein